MNDSTSTQPSILTEEDIHKISNFCRIFRNEKRCCLIYYLCELDRPVTWTNIQFDLRLNSKSLRDYLKIFKSNGIVEHNQYGFRVTDYGKKSLEIIENIGTLICPKEEG